MGIFDIFTGDTAKKAAADNQARLDAARTTDTNTLQQGQTGALSALSNAGSYYAPLSQKYGAGTGLYLDSLGVNGAGGNARATDAFHAGPGYQYAVDQSLEGVKRSANASGDPLGGNTLAALSDRAGNMANQEYGNWQTRLGGLISPEFQAVSGQAGTEAAKAPIYTNTASGIAGIDQNTVRGVNDQNTQAANAVTAGSGNLWGLGLNLAKLGVGALPGGSLLGGAGNMIGKALAPDGGYTGWAR